MTTATPGYNSKEKWNSSMRGSGLGAFVRSEIRLIVAFQAGAVAAFMVLLVVFMPINYLWSSPDGASSIWSLGASASSPFFRVSLPEFLHIKNYVLSKHLKRYLGHESGCSLLKYTFLLAKYFICLPKKNSEFQVTMQSQ